MGLFARGPAYLPLVVPRLDGTGWPAVDAVGRPSFEANAYHEVGFRHAFEPEAYEIADALVAAVLPHVPTGVEAEDEPYLRKVFLTAARTGAGLGRVERDLATPDLEHVDRSVAAALWQARRKLPAMRPDWALSAAYFLLAGYYVARTEVYVIPELVEQLGRPDA